MSVLSNASPMKFSVFNMGADFSVPDVATRIDDNSYFFIKDDSVVLYRHDKVWVSMVLPAEFFIDIHPWARKNSTNAYIPDYMKFADREEYFDTIVLSERSTKYQSNLCQLCLELGDDFHGIRLVSMDSRVGAVYGWIEYDGPLEGNLILRVILFSKGRVADNFIIKEEVYNTVWKAYTEVRQREFRSARYLNSFHGETWYECQYCGESFEYYSTKEGKCPYCGGKVRS